MAFVIKTKPGCPFCDKAKELMKETGETVTEQVYDDPVKIAMFKSQEGFSTFPQIWRNGVFIGGYTALAKYLDEQDTF